MNYQDALLKARDGWLVTHANFEGYMTGKGVDGAEGYLRSKVMPAEYEDYTPTPEDEAADWSVL